MTFIKTTINSKLSLICSLQSTSTIEVRATDGPADTSRMASIWQRCSPLANSAQRTSSALYMYIYRPTDPTKEAVSYMFHSTFHPPTTPLHSGLIDGCTLTRLTLGPSLRPVLPMKDFSPSPFHTHFHAAVPFIPSLARPLLRFSHLSSLFIMFPFGAAARLNSQADSTLCP